jgi:hypothetical protein
MQRFARTKLALVGLSVAGPLSAHAGDIPSYANGGFKSPAPAQAPARVVGLDGRVIQVGTPGGMPLAPAPRVMTEAEARAMTPPPRIVACAHSQHGVCKECQAVLDMPGTVTMMAAPAAPTMAGAPGRAVASAPGRAAAGGEMVQMAGPQDGPMPIGVMQANYQQGGAAAMPAPTAPATARTGAPGHASAALHPDAGNAPYQKPSKELRPSVLGHLFGWSYIGKDRRDARDLRSSQAHASIRYGDEGKTVEELPASMVYGPR